MFDRRTNLMLILGLLNDCFGDIRTTIVNLSDFMKSHPGMKEIEEFQLYDVLNQAQKLEERILEIMDKIKKEIY